MEGEVWKSVVGYEGIYEISSLARVRRITTGRILKQFLDSHGCPRVGLWLRGSGKSRLVSQLMADAFLPPKSPTDTVVRHLNDNPADNRAVNLARGTYSDNLNDAFRNGRARSNGSANHNAKLTEDKVREILSLDATGNFSQRELALQFGVHNVTINRIVRRRTWKHVV